MKLSALLVAAAIATGASAQTCPYTAESDCLLKSEGSCAWCVAGAVPSSCVEASEASKLPPAVFSCGTWNNTACATQTTADACSLVVGCSWCQSAAIPSVCATAQEATRLPAGAFTCTLSPGPKHASLLAKE